MGDENELDSSAGSFSSRSSPRSFDMLGGASSALLSSSVVARLLVASRAAIASLFLACLVPLVRSFLRRPWLVCLLFVLSVPLYRRIVWLPVRPTSGAGRWRFAFRFGFASVAVACCLPWRGRGCGGGGVSLVGLARCRRVDGVGRRRDFRPPRCLLRPRYHHGPSWADRRRALSSWLRFVVGCRGSSSFRLACPRVSSSVVFAP